MKKTIETPKYWDLTENSKMFYNEMLKIKDQLDFNCKNADYFNKVNDKLLTPIILEMRKKGHSLIIFELYGASRQLMLDISNGKLITSKQLS